jgi:hypothetical protein
MLDAARTSGTSPTDSNCTTDFHLFSDSPHASIYLLTPYSKPACAWIAEHISDNAMWFGSSLVIEYRYALALLAQIEREGLRVAVSRG